MKKMSSLAVVAVMLAAVSGVSAEDQTGGETKRSLKALQAEFLELKFGMFIHYNMATYVPGQWVSGYPNPSTFDPGGTVDTDAWADAAKSAGMTYGVLTAKHVGGFCLWDSKYSTYDVMHPDCPYKKDLVAQFIESFKSRGLRVGLYYCWRHPGFDAAAEQRNAKVKQKTGKAGQYDFKVLPPECDPATHTLKEQIAFQKKQIAELIEKYPDVFYIWNDALDPEIIPAEEARKFFRGLKPNLLTSANWWDWKKKGMPYLDVVVSETRHLADRHLENGTTGETCWCLESKWFYNGLRGKRVAKDIVAQLNKANSRKANFLLNVGPDQQGKVLDSSVETLEEIGRLWNSEAPPPGVLVGDVWWGPVSGKSPYDEFAIAFTLSEAGLEGVIHFMSDEKKVSELPLKEIRFDHPELAFRAGSFTFESIVDLEQGKMEGKSVGSSGPKMELIAERCDPATIPGLLSIETEYQYRQPPEKRDGLRVTAAQEVVLDPSKLEAMVRDMISGRGGAIHSLLLFQNDRLVLEEYFHDYDVDDLHPIASCTKSITSLLIGLALDQGLIPGVDAPVLDYFPAYAEDAAAGWSSVKLLHLLTMTAGLGWSQKELMQGRGADTGFGGSGPEGFRALLSRELVHEPGTRWNYSSPDVNLLGGIILQATGMQADAFAEKHLFTPLGIRKYDWSTYGKKDGYPNLAGSLWLRPRDMVKIGVLVLDEGRWQGKQLISPEWIRFSCTPQADTGDEKEGYGYLWWMMNLPGGKRIIQARGWGSQFILIDPEIRRVVVITGGNETNDKTFFVLQVLKRHLYPEAVKSEF
jgi:CubicO group peptidase (beta-lactamase class C family)/alpha-L-fucosidase